MSQFEVRLATTQEEREAIYRFRYKIYIEEKKKYHIPADHEQKRMYDEADAYSALYYILENGNMISSVRAMRGTDGAFLQRDIDFFGIAEFEKYFPHKELAIVNRLVVDANFRNTQVINETLIATYKGGINASTKICFIICDEWLLQRYEGFGSRIYGKPVELKNKMKRYRLLLILRDCEYLKKVKSPHLPYADRNLDDQGEYARKVTDLLGYPLSEGITPLSLKNKIKKAVYLAGLWFKQQPHSLPQKT